MIERGGITMNPSNREWFYRSLRIGGGNIFLTLTGEQYEKLLAA